MSTAYLVAVKLLSEAVKREQMKSAAAVELGPRSCANSLAEQAMETRIFLVQTVWRLWKELEEINEGIAWKESFIGERTTSRTIQM